MERHEDGGTLPPPGSSVCRGKGPDASASHLKLMQGINKLRRSRERLREELRDVRTLLNTPAETILMVDREGTVLDLNEVTAQRVGRNVSQLLGRCIWDCFPEDLARVRKLNAEEVFCTGMPTRFEDKDKGVWYDNVMYPVFDNKSNVIKVAIFARDITEIKNSQETLRSTTEQLSMLLESLPIVPYSRKAEGDWGTIYIGNAIEEITGYSAEQFEQDERFWLDHVHPEDRPRIFRELEEQRLLATQRFEYRFRCADGSYKWLSNLRRVFRNPDGTFSHIAGTWQDITGEMKLRQETEHHRQQMIQADKLASLGEVVAGVAHEINNPNSFIGYNLPLIEETWNLFRPIILGHLDANPCWSANGIEGVELIRGMDEMIDAVKVGSERINRVVTNLKDFVRREESIHRVPLLINDVIGKAMTIVGSQARKSVGTILVDLADDLPLLEGDFQKLEQVVTNLVLNAIHALAARDGGRLAIRTRLCRGIGSVVIEVEDNGTGMAPEVMERIFEPFFTTRRNTGGTGLGLSVAYNLIKEHDGTLAVLSQPGRGSRFSVLLPVGYARPNLRPTILCLGEDGGISREVRSSFLNMIQLPLVRTTREGVEQAILEHPEVDILLAHHSDDMQEYMPLLEEVSSRFPLLTVIVCAPDASRHVPPHWHVLVKPLLLHELQEIVGTTPRVRV